MKIVILSSTKESDGSFTVSGAFWLNAPTNSVIAKPDFKSKYHNIDSSTLTAIKTGTLLEQTFTTGLFDAGTTLDVVQSTIASMYDAAQANLISEDPPVLNLIGSSFDGTNWSSVIAPTFLPKPVYTSNQIYLRWSDWKTLLLTRRGL